MTTQFSIFSPATFAAARRGLLRAGMLAGCMALALQCPAYAEEKAADLPAINVRGGAHAGFDRLVFDWPQKTAYEVNKADDHVTVIFARAAQLNTRPTQAARLTRVGDFEQSTADEKTVFTFRIPPESKVTNFLSGTYIVIDIAAKQPLGPASAKKEAETPPEKEKTEEKKTEEKTEDKIEAAMPAPEVKPEEKPATEAAPAETAATAAAPESTPEKISETKSEAIGEAPAQTVVTPAAETAQMPATEAAQKSGPDIVVDNPMQIAPETTSESAAEIEDIIPDIAPTAKIDLPRIGTTPVQILGLDPGTPTSLAVYARGGYIYILFDRKLGAGLDTLAAGPNAPRIKLEPLALPVTGWRFPLPSSIDVRVTKEGNLWRIFLANERRRIPVTIAMVAEPDYALGARVVLPVVQAPAPIRFKDPVIGDTIIVVPLPRGGESLSVPRQYADFDIVPAMQGLVVHPINETVTARQVPDGIEISAEGGLKLSPTDDAGSHSFADTGENKLFKLRLFDFENWRGKPGESYTRARQRLSQIVVEVPLIERDRARFELARLYFAHGYAAETLGMLRYLEDRMPDLAARPEFIALRGAARIMADDPNGGLRDFSMPELAQEPETQLWQAVALAEKRNWELATPRFINMMPLLEQYPEPFFSKFAVLAMESALANGKTAEASEWLDRWQQRENAEEFLKSPPMLYLQGVLNHQQGHADKAETFWKRAEMGNDRLYRTRAELALIDLDVARGSEPVEAAKKLEGIRFGWRGDELEIDILHRLGNFYIAAGQVKNGLLSLNRAVKTYPGHPLTNKIREQMVTNFRDVFLGESGANMSPIESLALYQEFRDLMPPPPDSIAIIKILAERLVNIDLLDQAAGLLENLVEDHLQGEEKAKTGARLAGIRLLNQQPELALEALDMSRIDGIKPALEEERFLLRARALSERGKYEEAQQVLTTLGSTQADILRADIAWRANKWKDAAAILGQMIGPPPESGKTISSDDAQLIINRATALALAGDQAALDRMAIDFGPAMSGTDQADAFRLMTRGKFDINSRDVAALQPKIGEIDMFRKFLDKYRAQESADGEQKTGN